LQQLHLGITALSSRLGIALLLDAFLPLFDSFDSLLNELINIRFRFGVVLILLGQFPLTLKLRVLV